eukprot:6600527-Alexandrium_andersonii.AAC.1
MRADPTTLTSSRVMYVVPEGHTPEHFMCRQFSPSIPFSSSSSESPPIPFPIEEGCRRVR